MKAEIKLDEQSLRDLLRTIKKLGGDAVGALEKATDAGAKILEDHAKDRHFFMGTKKHTKEEERKSELAFTNPDGTIRFRIRTGALRNGIMMQAAKRVKDGVFSQVVSASKYSKDVEYGGPGRRPFPFFTPAAEEKTQAILDKARQIFKGFIDRWKA